VLAAGQLRLSAVIAILGEQLFVYGDSYLHYRLTMLQSARNFSLTLLLRKRSGGLVCHLQVDLHFTFAVVHTDIS